MGDQPRAAPEPYEPGLMPPLVPVGKATGTNASFLAGQKPCFLLVVDACNEVTTGAKFYFFFV